MTIIPPIFDKIPAELRNRPQWVVWRQEERDGELTKIPYNPHIRDKRASSTAPTTWGTFEEVCAAYSDGGSFDGIGFVFYEDDPFVGIDLDDCVTNDRVEPWAQAIVDRLDSYTEHSPSGRGLHIIVKGSKPGPRCRAKHQGGEVEMYDAGRYFAMTGALCGGLGVIEERREQIQQLYISAFNDPVSARSVSPAANVPKTIVCDDDLIAQACSAANGAKFAALYAGDWSNYPSQSEADIALCMHLAFWFGKDPEAIDRVFRRSGLYRSKWDEKRGNSTYGQGTIAKAIETTTETYSPRRPAAHPSRTQGADRPGAWAGVGEMTLCNYDDVAKQILGVRQKKSRNDFETNAEVAKVVVEDLKQRGTFYHDGQAAYFFFGKEDKRLVEIEGYNDEFKLALARYGLNATENIYRYVTEHLRVEGLEQGEGSDVHRFSHYRPQTFTLYLSNGNQVIRIAPWAIEPVDNGTDGVLFLHDRKYEPFELGEYDPSVSWLDEVIISKINFVNDRLTVNDQRLVFTLWFYSLFFESIMPTKPIQALIGEKGSGKSFTHRMLGKVLFGKSFDVMELTKDSRDFDAAVANSYFMAIDNADYRYRWLEDRLATAATGGTLKVRKFYTNITLMEIPVRCFLAINSRTPHFRREDVADRLLVMKVARIDPFSPESELLDEVLVNRDRIMSEVVHQLQEIVRALKAEEGNSYSGTFRMADFADFATKVGRQTGVEKPLESVFEKLAQEQTAFALEGDPLFKLLKRWVTNGNAGQWVTSERLHKELAELAEVEEVDFPYGNAWSIGQLLRKDRRSMLEQFFDVKHDDKGGRKRFYSFRLKS